MNFTIFEFYKWINQLDCLTYICFTICDDDGGSSYECSSVKEVIDILFDSDEISIYRLYRMEYSVCVHEIKFNGKCKED